MKKHLVISSLLLCACGVPHEQYQAALDANQRLRTDAADERARLAALQSTIDDLVVIIDDLDGQKVALEKQAHDSQTSFEKAEVARQALEEVNGQLLTKQRELTRLSEHISSTWYQSALERAKRSAPKASRTSGSDD